jgi:multicomponent Na+:H+ antiporter subunit E
MGFGIGYAFLLVISWNFEDRRYFEKIPLLLFFAVFYVYELVRSTLEVAWDVLTPSDLTRPGIVRVPLTLQSDFQIAILMNLITFTPGSLSVELSEDKKFLYVHGMFIYDKDKFVESIKKGFEEKIARLFR